MPRRHPIYETHRPQPVARRHFFKRMFGALTGGLVLGTAHAAGAQTSQPNSTEALTETPFMGQIVMFGAPWAPRGWFLCDGAEYSTITYSAMFSLLGTQYGGNGLTTFAVPDLRGRVPVGSGSGIGLTNRNIGQTGGEHPRIFPLHRTRIREIQTRCCGHGIFFD